MPAAIPMIVGGVVASAAGTATLFTIGTLAFSAATVYGGLAAFAASALMGAINRPDAPQLGAAITGPGGSRTQLVRQPITPHQIVFGRVKTSGPMVFWHSKPDDGGRADGYSYLQLVPAAHHVKSIGTVYFNDDLSSASQFTGYARVGKQLGTATQVEEPDFLAELGSVFTNHWLRGRANIAVRLKGNATAFPTGLPNVSAIVDGCDEIYDPRTGLTGYTNNPALCIGKWGTATWGANRPWSTWNEPSVIASANVCDERVLVLTHTTAFTTEDVTEALALASGSRILDWGDGFRVSSTGTLPGGLSSETTYYAIPVADGKYRPASSVANAFAGTPVDITDAGTGTHTLTYFDEARYKCNGTFSLDMQKRDVLEQLLTSMAGVRVRIGSKWFLHAGAAATPTVTLDEDDLRGNMTTVPVRSMRDRHNGVRAVFVNPDNNWQPGDAPPLTPSPTLLDEDADQELYMDVRAPFVTSARQMQRLMKIALMMNRQQRTVSYPAKLTAFKLSAWDGMYLTNERYGWTAEEHRVTGWALAADGGIDLQLQIEDGVQVYGWTSIEELPLAIQQEVVLPDGTIMAAPDYLTVITPQSLTFTKIFVEWPEVASAWLTGYDLEHRAHTVTDWTSYGVIAGESARKADVVRTLPTDFRIRAVAASANSFWTENIAPGPPTSVTESTPGIITWVNDATCATIQLFKDGVLFNDTLLGPSQTTGALNDGSYQLRSVNSRGNFSTISATIVITTEGPGGGGGGLGDGSSDDDGDGDE